jgi:hypothetical protein
MPEIRSPEDLLHHLARSGDPSAFYTIIAPYAHTAYIAARSSGKTHNEALSSLIPFLKKSYRNFQKKPGNISVETWYNELNKKWLKDKKDDWKEAALENISSSDVSHFDAQIKLAFQRSYGKMLRSEQGSFFKRWRASIRSHPALRFALYCCSLLLLLGALHVSLTIAHIQLALSIRKSNIWHELPLLPFANNAASSSSSASSPQLIKDTVGNSAPAHADSQFLMQPVMEKPLRAPDAKKAAALADSAAGAHPKPLHRAAPHLSIRGQDMPVSNDSSAPAARSLEPQSQINATPALSVQKGGNYSNPAPRSQKKPPDSPPESSATSFPAVRE